jgi:hypothetical protein
MSAASVVSVTPDHRIRRIDHYGLDQLDEARARFAELRADLLRIPPNAASRTSDLWFAAFEAGDREALEALVAPEIQYEDRERGSFVSGDGATLIASMLSRGHGVKVSRTLLATAGDRLALERVLWSGTGWPGVDEAGEFEQEFLRLIDVDVSGRIVAAIFFDPGDRRAASREMLERAARGGTHGPLVELRRALLDRDLERLRSILPVAFRFHDHRKLAAGRIENADVYLAWMATLFAESSDAIIEPLHYLARDERGALSVAHTFGTSADGGAFESVYLMVAGESSVDLFELDDLERARARFEELRPEGGRPGSMED